MGKGFDVMNLLIAAGIVLGLAVAGLMWVVL